MSHEMDHARFSELLGELHAGTLDEETAGAVRRHVDTCDECLRELEAVTAMAALDAAPPMTPAERSHLEHVVMAGIAGDPVTTVVPLAPRSHHFTRRIGQALGAAAVVAIIATFGYLAIGGGMGGQDSTDTAGGDTAERAVPALGDQDDGPVPEPERAGKEEKQVSAAADAGAGGAEFGDTGSLAAPAPIFSVAREPLTGDRLERLGESGIATVRYANAYRSRDADSKTDLLGQLVDDARRRAGAGTAEQIEECAGQVLESDDPILPSFALVGSLNDRDVLVMGFAWSRRSSGRLDRYMVWAWERGDCGSAVEYIEGRIRSGG